MVTTSRYYVLTVKHKDGKKTTKLVDEYNFYYWHGVLAKKYGASNVDNDMLQDGKLFTYDVALQIYDKVQLK